MCVTLSNALSQVQGVQSLQGLQLPQAQGGQQLTLAPVQGLSMGQGGSITLPNLQTVTVNSIGQPGIQYTQGEEAGSPAGRNMHTYTHTHTQTPSFYFFLTLSLTHPHILTLSPHRHPDKGGAGL